MIGEGNFYTKEKSEIKKCDVMPPPLAITECQNEGGVSKMWLINKNDIKSIELDGNCVITKLTIKRKYGKRKREINVFSFNK